MGRYCAVKDCLFTYLGIVYVSLYLVLCSSSTRSHLLSSKWLRLNRFRSVCKTVLLNTPPRFFSHVSECEVLLYCRERLLFLCCESDSVAVVVSFPPSVLQHSENILFVRYFSVGSASGLVNISPICSLVVIHSIW